MTDRIIIVNEAIQTPDNRPYWIIPDVLRGIENPPEFSTGGVSKIFFATHPATFRYWLWKEESKGGPILDGSRIEIEQRDGYRVYSIEDVEKLAHAFARAGYIDGDRLGKIVLMVKTCAQMYGIPL